jgi:hypothetical protein
LEEAIMRRIVIRLAFLVLFASPNATASGSDAAPAATLSKLAIQRRDAARKTFEVTWANYRDRRASEETVYRWSLRWLEAERQLCEKPADHAAAYRSHAERMLELDRLIGKVQRARQATIDEVNASEYYRVESEIWLLQAEEKKIR